MAIEVIDTDTKKQERPLSETPPAIKIWWSSENYGVTVKFEPEICKKNYDFVISLLESSARLVKEMKEDYKQRLLAQRAYEQHQEEAVLKKMKIIN